MPMIAGLRKMRADTVGDGGGTMIDVVEAMCVELLDHFPLSRVLGDETHDAGAVGWIARRYGEGIVEGVNFGTVAQMSLWHDTLHYVASPEGFPWPDRGDLVPGSRVAADMAELEEQITVEQAELNGRGQYSFYHPGEHNDFLHGFNLSCKAMREVQLSGTAGDVDVFTAQGSIPYRMDRRLAPLALGGRPGRGGY